MTLSNEQRQKHTDEQRGEHDRRESGRVRFGERGEPTTAVYFQQIIPASTIFDHLAQWEKDDQRKREIERQEKAAFNLKYGYKL